MHLVLDPIDILVVEDDEGDVLMIREALSETKIPSVLNVVDNGEDALRYLRREDPYAGATRPDLVLLDLNLPRLDGRQVLSTIKDDSTLRRIPVVILTTSSNLDDIEHSYDQHANAYVTKPVGFEEFVQVIREIDSFYTSTAQLPHQPDH